MTNSCTCKAEHWQPHADTCPANVDRPLLTLENIRSGTVPSDAHAVGFLLGEIERLQTEWNNASDLGNALLTEAVRLRAEVRALRIGHGFADPDSLDAPAHEPGAVASFPLLSIDPAADEVVDRLVADRLSKKSVIEPRVSEWDGSPEGVTHIAYGSLPIPSERSLTETSNGWLPVTNTSPADPMPELAWFWPWNGRVEMVSGNWHIFKQPVTHWQLVNRPQPPEKSI